MSSKYPRSYSFYHQYNQYVRSQIFEVNYGITDQLLQRTPNRINDINRITTLFIAPSRDYHQSQHELWKEFNNIQDGKRLYKSRQHLKYGSTNFLTIISQKKAAKSFRSNLNFFSANGSNISMGYQYKVTCFKLFILYP